MTETLSYEEHLQNQFAELEWQVNELERKAQWYERKIHDRVELISVREFCFIHNACNPGRVWAAAACKNMFDVWRLAPPLWLNWVATRPGVLTESELRAFAVFAARKVQPLLPYGDNFEDMFELGERAIRDPDCLHPGALGKHRCTFDRWRHAVDTRQTVSQDYALHAARATTFMSAARAADSVYYNVPMALFSGTTPATSGHEARQPLEEEFAAWFRKHTLPLFWR